MLDLKKTECMGCQQCANTCPKGAITYSIVDGFLYPKINEDQCISCGLCEKKCPAFSDSITETRRPNVYAAWTKNACQRTDSTSGGICYELSKYIIDSGGKVAGVSWTKDFKDAKYELVHDSDGLRRITHSKYFQPKTGLIYSQIKQCLDHGETVLFIGSACYGEALRLYLGKEYQNLICIDFICRGYTSQIFHQKRIEDLEEKMGSKVSDVHYKHKKKGWNRFGTFFRFENGKEYYVNRYDDPYEIMFQLDDYNTRPSCYECKYRTAIRKADITVGDFWGIKRVDPDSMNKGISVVLINSEKGQQLFDSIKDRIEFQRRDLYEVSEGNMALRNNLKMREGAELFFKDLEEKAMEFVYKRYAGRENKRAMGKKFGEGRELVRCNIVQFIKLNYFCPSVVREKGKYIIPYKGAVVKVDKKSRIYVKDNLFLNTQKHGRTREEMFFTVCRDATVMVNGRTSIATGSTIDVLPNASLSMGRAETNIGVVIVCSNSIEMGDDVQIGRGVMIYDSNYHPTGLNRQKNPRPLKIGNHVWLCTGVTITKGLKIGSGAICGINSTIMSNVKERTMVMGNPAKVIMTEVEW